MEIIRTVLLIYFSIKVLAGDSTARNDGSGVLDEIDARLDNLLANDDIESISAGVIISGERYDFHKGRLLDGGPPTNNTLYEIASLTKTFTGTLLAEAIVDNKIRIDDDIRLYLPGSYPNLEFDGVAITFRHLATHQSGLPHMFPEIEGIFDNPNWDELPFRINKRQENFSKKDFFESLAKVRLSARPGSTFSYSNAGANLLGYLLEEIYETTFNQLLKAKILDPLEMFETGVSISNVDKDRLARGQNVDRIEMPFRTEKAMNSEGGIITSIPDMLKYIAYHLESENQVVSAAQQPLWNGKYGKHDAGCFWQIIIGEDGAKTVFQNGGAFGTSSWLTLIPDRNIGIFVVTNISGANIHQKLSETVSEIVEAIEKSLDHVLNKP